MEKNRISVIVPIYNVEKYLDRCVESIVNQTYKNLEIILVDDGSPDSCPQMCDEWAKKDKRIRVVHQVNKGGAEARNVGLDIATGDFIAFVDSDDYIDKAMYELLIHLLQEYDADIVECDYSEVTPSDNICPIISKETVVYSARDSLLENIKGSTCKDVIWNKLYKAKVVDKVRFVKGKRIDDVFWTYKVLGNADIIAVNKSKLYYYVQQSDSIMHRSQYSYYFLQAVEAKDLRAQYIKTKYPELYEFTVIDIWFFIMYHYQKVDLYLHNEEKTNAIAYLRSVLKKYPIRFNIELLTFKQNFWLVLFKAFPKLTINLRNKLRIGT